MVEAPSTPRDSERESERDSERDEARRRVQAKRDFGSHLVAYVVVNAMLTAVWALTGAGYFWPVWVIACWGAGLVIHAWDVYFRRPVTESDIEAEISHTRRHG